MNRFSFFVPGRPQAKERPRFNSHGRAYTPHRTSSYESLVQACCLQEMTNRGIQSQKVYEGPVAMTVIAYFQPPKSASKRNRDLMYQGEIFPLIRPDVDNIVKAVCDALNHLMYKDDSQIIDMRVLKRYSHREGVLVTIYKEGDLGAFRFPIDAGEKAGVETKKTSADSQ